MSITFLSLARILELQRESIDVYGGDPGVRDMGLLESAIAQPRATFGGAYLHEGMAAKAAAYLYHLVMNRPFVDGNKRIGALAAFVFLDMNDIELRAPEDEFEQLTLGVARGEVSKEAVTLFFEQNIKE